MEDAQGAKVHKPLLMDDAILKLEDASHMSKDLSVLVVKVDMY